MTTASPLGRLMETYIGGRRERGEISGTTAQHLTTRIGGLVAGFTGRSVIQLDRQAILDWQRSIGSRAPATRHAYLCAVHGFCEWLVLEGHIVADPTAGLPRVRVPRSVPRALTAQAVRQLLATAPDDRALTALWLMIGCGLRRGEVAALSTRDYDSVAGTVLIHGKNGDERLLPVPATVAVVLDRYLLTLVGSGPLIRRGGQGVSPQSITIMTSKLMTRAGVKWAPGDGWSAHSLRRTCATDVFAQCRDLVTIQAMLGHRSLAATERYLRPADLDQLREAMAGRDYRPAA